MTTGATILAFNNGVIDYAALAAWSAHRIKRWLNIPVCVITNVTDVDPVFDYVIQVAALGNSRRYFEDLKTSVTWHNANRADAYDLTPWDRTLLLDADYVVNSSSLKVLLNSNQTFLCHRYATDLARGSRLDNLNWFGRYRFPQWWATVMMFQRCDETQHIFSAMRMVRDHWEHYRTLYAIANPTYRNDHALSIALGIATGHTLKTNDIPWNLQSVLPEDELIRIDDDTFDVACQVNDHKRYVRIRHTDFHAMGKGHLGAIVASH